MNLIWRSKLMEEIIETYKEYDIKHIALFSPFENRSDRQWPGDEPFVKNKYEFIKHCYAEPCFDKIENQLRDELKSNKKQTIKSRIIAELNEKIKLVTAKRIAKTDFENGLETSSDNPIYIRGFAGTGKTTYLNTLLLRKKQKAEKESYSTSNELYDMTLSSETLTFLSLNWRNCNFSKTLNKFISVLMAKLNEFLSVNANESENEFKSRLKNILTNYYDYIFKCGLRIYTDVFSIIEKFVNGEIKYNTTSLSDISNEVFCKLMYNIVVSYCPQKGSSEDEVDQSIDKLLELSVILMFCSHSKEEIDGKKFKHFIFFDNIENFIKGNMVYDSDINTIARIMNQFVDSLTERFKIINNGNITFSQHFKIILAIRDTTENIIDEVYLQDDCNPKIQLDVSTWFSLDEIIDNKIKYFKKNGILPCSEIQYKIIKYIFSDSTSTENGLSDIFSQMYNYNKRRIIIYLTSALQMHQICGEDYIHLWETAKKYDNGPKTNENIELAATYKNGARQIIMRLLLDYIEDTNYFEAINTLREDRETLLGSGMARKILTYLYRRVPLSSVEDEVENLGFVGFNTLLREVMVSPCRSNNNPQSYRSKIEILARIMYKLNSSSEESTHWCQLIIIKFGQKDFDPAVLAEQIYKDFEANNDDKAYGVKICDAGRYFVKAILPNFEYFACRYAKQTFPLFSGNNLTIVRESDNKYNFNTVATELLETISKQVICCINAIISQDLNFFTTTQNHCFDGMYSVEGCTRRYCYEPATRSVANYGNEQCHPLRIINNHLSYLDNYRAFILTYKKSNDTYYYNDVERKGVSETILKIIKKYIDILNNILDDRIGENGEIINGASYVGNVNVSKEKRFARMYFDRWEEAEASPLDSTIRIKRDYFT